MQPQPAPLTTLSNVGSDSFQFLFVHSSCKSLKPYLAGAVGQLRGMLRRCCERGRDGAR